MFKVQRSDSPPSSLSSMLPPDLLLTMFMINQLHWLPLSLRFQLKIVVLVAKSKLGVAPKYLRVFALLYLQHRIDHSTLSTGRFSLFRGICELGVINLWHTHENRVFDPPPPVHTSLIRFVDVHMPSEKCSIFRQNFSVSANFLLFSNISAAKNSWPFFSHLL